MRDDKKILLEKSMRIFRLTGMNQAFFTFTLFFLVGVLFIDRFTTSTNLINVFRQGALIFSFSVGMTITMLLSGLDLSIGAVGAISSVFAATLIKSGHVYLGVLVGLLIGVTLGLMSGIAIARFGVPSFIMTFSMMKIANGLALEFTQGQSIYGFPNTFRFIGIGDVGPFPMPLILNFIILLVLAFILSRTVFGRSVYAVGNSLNAAKFSGIPCEFTIAMGYMIAGLFSAFAGLLLIARLGSAEGIMGDSWPRQAIAASVLGGVSFAGGKGSIVGTAFGALCVAILYNVLNLLGVESSWQEFFLGFIILSVISLDCVKTIWLRKREVSRRLKRINVEAIA
jgi:ribose transport system permease protein